MSSKVSSEALPNIREGRNLAASPFERSFMNEVSICSLLSARVRHCLESHEISGFTTPFSGPLLFMIIR